MKRDGVEPPHRGSSSGSCWDAGHGPALTAALGCSPTSCAPAWSTPSATRCRGLVEIDEASLPFRTKDDPPTGGQGRSHDGKMLIVGAIELRGRKHPRPPAAGRNLLLRRRRPRTLRRNRRRSRRHRENRRLVRLRCGPADRHNVHVVGKTAAHLVLHDTGCCSGMFGQRRPKSRNRPWQRLRGRGRLACPGARRGLPGSNRRGRRRKAPG